MSLEFTQLAWLPLAALIAVPILLHFFARARPPAYWFSSTEFIRRILRFTMRLRRPQDLLLLVLRSLLYAALIALFLQPVLHWSRRLAGPRVHRHVVVLVDGSASLAFRDGAQTRFALARAEASAVLGDLKPGDTANVIWMRAVPEPVFPELGINLSRLQDELRRATVGSEAADLEGAYRLALEQLRGAEGRKEICVISDFQATAWRDVRFDPPRDVELVTVRVGAGDGANQALTRIAVRPALPLVGEEVDVECEVANYSDAARSVSVFLQAGDARQQRDVRVAAWGRAPAVFRCKFAAAGPVVCKAALDEDGFVGDNQRWAVAMVRGQLRVGVAGNVSGTGEAWVRALRALGWARVELAPGAPKGVQPFDALLLDGWDGAAGRAEVEALLQRGASVVWFPADRTPAAAVAALAGRPAPNETGLFGPDVTRGARALRLVRPEDPLFRIFQSGEYGDPTRGSYGGRWQVPARAVEGWDLLLAYEDGVPALARAERGGALYLWNLRLDRDVSDGARQPEFVPLMGEMLLQGRDALARSEAVAESTPGQWLSWQPDQDVPDQDVTLVAEGGGVLPLTRSVGAGARFVSPRVAESGLYTWEVQGKPVRAAVVNFPTIESDLRALPRIESQRLGAAAVDHGQAVRRLREGVRLWPVLLGVALLAALLEGAVTVWAERT